MNLVNLVESGTLFRVLCDEGVHWKNMFSRLAKLANDVIETMHTKLEAAEVAMHLVASFFGDQDYLISF